MGGMHTNLISQTRNLSGGPIPIGPLFFVGRLQPVRSVQPSRPCPRGGAASWPPVQDSAADNLELNRGLSLARPGGSPLPRLAPLASVSLALTATLQGESSSMPGLFAALLPQAKRLFLLFSKQADNIQTGGAKALLANAGALYRRFPSRVQIIKAI